MPLHLYYIGRVQPSLLSANNPCFLTILRVSWGCGPIVGRSYKGSNMSNETKKVEHHFYACTGDTWVTDEDLFKALTRLKNATGLRNAHYIVANVPLPESAEYQINWYMPQVEGATLIAEGNF